MDYGLLEYTRIPQNFRTQKRRILCSERLRWLCWPSCCWPLPRFSLELGEMLSNFLPLSPLVCLLQSFKIRLFHFKKRLGYSRDLFFITAICGHDFRNFEPRKRLKFEDIDKSIQKLRAMFKIHPEWFETPKPKSNKGKNEVDYSF